MISTPIVVRHLTLAAILSLIFSACTVTQTAKDILGSTKDFLSSTTPGDWFSGDGVLKADHKVIAFVAFNFENLKQDMAKGRGEYLASLSELFDVPQDRREAFYSFAQSRYQLIKTRRGGPEELVALLAPAQS
jgi:Protein of unknown function (DUF3015)